MLGLLFKKKTKNSLEDTVILIQQGDEALLNELISSYKPFIAKTVSQTCKRYIYETDDEFSIGLIAFHEAVQKYNPEKGKSLLSFAEVIIKRKVIDYIRKNGKDIPIRFDVKEDDIDGDSKGASVETTLSLDFYQQKQDEAKRKEEILLFSQKLKDFNLSFQEIIQESPKHADARQNAILIAKLIHERPPLAEFLLKKKRLPLKELEELVAVSRKTMERNRKYIIAIYIIITSEFHYLRHYLKEVIET